MWIFPLAISIAIAVECDAGSTYPPFFQPSNFHGEPKFHSVEWNGKDVGKCTKTWEMEITREEAQGCIEFSEKHKVHTIVSWDTGFMKPDIIRTGGEPPYTNGTHTIYGITIGEGWRLSKTFHSIKGFDLRFPTPGKKFANITKIMPQVGVFHPKYLFKPGTMQARMSEFKHDNRKVKVVSEGKGEDRLQGIGWDKLEAWDLSRFSPLTVGLVVTNSEAKYSGITEYLPKLWLEFAYNQPRVPGPP